MLVADAPQKTNLAVAKGNAKRIFSPRVEASLASWQNLLHRQVNLERAWFMVVSSSVSAFIFTVVFQQICVVLCVLNAMFRLSPRYLQYGLNPSTQSLVQVSVLAFGSV